MATPAGLDPACCFSVSKELTLSPRNTHPLGFHLIAETALIFPERSSHPGLGPRRSHLASGIIDVALQRRPGGVSVPGRGNRMVCHWQICQPSRPTRKKRKRLTWKWEQLRGHLSAHRTCRRWMPRGRRGDSVGISVLRIGGRAIGGGRLQDRRLLVRVMRHGARRRAL